MLLRGAVYSVPAWGESKTSGWLPKNLIAGLGRRNELLNTEGSKAGSRSPIYGLEPEGQREQHLQKEMGWHLHRQAEEDLGEAGGRSSSYSYHREPC